jgi:hypothetical protein
MRVNLTIIKDHPSKSTKGQTRADSLPQKYTFGTGITPQSRPNLASITTQSRMLPRGIEYYRAEPNISTRSRIHKAMRTHTVIISPVAAIRCLYTEECTLFPRVPATDKQTLSA